MDSNKIKIAVIDLYNNEENQGMRCIRDIIKETNSRFANIPVEHKIYDARYRDEIPDSNYDIYISSGGPGSPFEGEGSDWEKKYFELMDSIWSNNQNKEDKKHVFFICHSFQIMARYFKFGSVIKRHSNSFGVMPVHKTKAGKYDELLTALPDIFYAADFRDYQVVQPDQKILNELGAEITCIEKERNHVPYERAIMAVRISPEIIGTQFHPEADPESMYYHFKKPERKEQVVSKYGIGKYDEMLALLEEPDAIQLTRKTVLPNFLNNAIKNLRPEKALA